MKVLLRRILPSPVKALLKAVLIGVLNSVRFLTGGLFRLLVVLIGRKGAFGLYHLFNTSIDKTLMVDGIRFDGSAPIPFRRAMTLLETEPETILWINTYMNDGDVFYDVGANIGLYTLYAASKRNVQVRAFEPMCTNFDILNRNIFLNGLKDRAVAFNIALNDTTALSEFNMSAFEPGKAGHDFGGASAEEAGFEPAYRQGVMGVSMDELVATFGQPFPNHVKIDVDGNEPKIIKGMKSVLADKRLKSIVVELAPDSKPDDRQALDAIQSAGFTLLEDEKYTNLSLSDWTDVRNFILVRP